MTAAPSIPVIDAAALLGEPMTALCQAPWTQVTAATDSNRCLWKALHKQRYQGFEQGATDVAAAPLSRPACTSARLQASRPPPAGGSWAVGLRPLAPRGPAAPRRRRGGTPRLLSDSAESAQATAAGRCCCWPVLLGPPMARLPAPRRDCGQINDRAAHRPARVCELVTAGLAAGTVCRLALCRCLGLLACWWTASAGRCGCSGCRRCGGLGCGVCVHVPIISRVTILSSCIM